jgi:hypothetical protein
MKTTAALASLLALAGTANAQTALYDTFNEAEQSNLFDCCNYAVFYGSKVEGRVQDLAVPFTPQADGWITEIDFAFDELRSGGRLAMSLRRDAAGLPGETMHSWIRAKSAQTDTCCAYRDLWGGNRSKSIYLPVQAGSTYWFVLRRRGGGEGGWNFNSIGASGPYAIYANGAWSMTEGQLPAVRLYWRTR